MPKRDDIRKILVVGSGPIVIGQACEFDYSGTQAVKALRAEGYSVVLVNSNPATIMTDPDVADRTYVEPITREAIARIIEHERPDALLPTLGGQTALNAALELAEDGVLERFGVELIGASLEAIRRAEDRGLFRECMVRIGAECPRSGFVATVREALELAEDLGYPVIVRPSFTLGGHGSGTARTPDDLARIAGEGIHASPVGTVLIEESALGWKEFELEVMRDRRDNAIVVCSIENVDPMGVHTGDSITVAPQQTLSDREYQEMRDEALRVIREIGVDTGGSNIQFAVEPVTRRRVVIEMNPRVSRSSALASKATGFPIAKIAALLAVGYTLDEIPNDITRVTPASFEPALDYVVVKIPRWAFEKFPNARPELGTRMKSVGEVMAIGRTFEEALWKGLQSTELEAEDGLRRGDVVRPGWLPLEIPHPMRIYQLLNALRAGASPDDLAARSGIEVWFLRRMAKVVGIEAELSAAGGLDAVDRELLRNAKRAGLSDGDIAARTGADEEAVRARRLREGILPTMKAVDTCAAEFPAETPYYYSTYEVEDEGEPLGRKSVVILGSGPNRIGQGIEFDYCCVQAAYGLREEGWRVILVNSNPETVSTDYDTSDRLYFEPLSPEHVRNILDKEKPEGVVLQLGGQTPLSLARDLERAGARILGTSTDAIDRAENRERFRALIEKLGLTQPRSLAAGSVPDALRMAEEIGYPVLIRPSYVLGGRGMRILYDRPSLVEFLAAGVKISPEEPLLIDSFLEDAVELDVDAVSDGTDVLIGGILEHIEEAGIHSGDSACVTPPYSIGEDLRETLVRVTREIALELGVRGLLNIQFAVKSEQVFVLEVNPRASRTVPFLSKATGVPLARIAAKVIAGRTLRELGTTETPVPARISVKRVVLPFDRFPGEDTLLGPEMKSTGEVMGIDLDFGRAFAKAHLSAHERLPLAGNVFLSVSDSDKRAIVFLTKQLVDMGFRISATRGTSRFLRMNGIASETLNKIHEGSPNAVDRIREGKIDLVINTPLGGTSKHDDRWIRRAALDRGIVCVTTIPGASAAVSAIQALRRGSLDVEPLQAVYAAASAPDPLRREATDPAPGSTDPARAVRGSATA